MIITKKNLTKIADEKQMTLHQLSFNKETNFYERQKIG